MAHEMTRREFATAVGVAALAAHGFGARAEDAKKTLRFIAQSDLRVLDPIWTTAYITRNHGYMVFDTLFAIDAEFAPHPDGRRARHSARQADLSIPAARRPRLS